MNDPIRVGVIGAGGIAQVAHLPVLRRLPGVEVAAICDNDLGKAQALAARFEVKDTYDDIEEVLRYGHVDVVDLHAEPSARDSRDLRSRRRRARPVRTAACAESGRR